MTKIYTSGMASPINCKPDTRFHLDTTHQLSSEQQALKRILRIQRYGSRKAKTAMKEARQFEDSFAVSLHIFKACLCFPKNR